MLIRLSLTKMNTCCISMQKIQPDQDIQIIPSSFVYQLIKYYVLQHVTRVVWRISDVCMTCVYYMTCFWHLYYVCLWCLYEYITWTHFLPGRVFRHIEWCWLWFLVPRWCEWLCVSVVCGYNHRNDVHSLTPKKNTMLLPILQSWMRLSVRILRRNIWDILNSKKSIPYSLIYCQTFQLFSYSCD